MNTERIISDSNKLVLKNTEQMRTSTETGTNEEAYKDYLAQKVIDIVHKSPEVHDREFLMDGIAGFSPARLVARYIYLREEMDSQNVSLLEMNQVFSQMVETDTLAYAREFLYRTPILQTEYAVCELNGVSSVVSPKYDPSSALHTHVSLKEREGAVFNGVINLEHAILEARQHSTILYASPSGWNGTATPFEEAQIHVVNIQDNQIVDTTIRNSLNLPELKLLVQNFSGQEMVTKSQVDLIKEISQTVIAIPEEITPEDILLHMQQVRSSDIAWNRMKFDPQLKRPVFDRSFTFAQMKEVLQKDSFLETSNEVESVVRKLTQYLEVHADIDEHSLRGMVREIGKTALIIAESVGYEVGEITERRTQNGDYSQATKYASEGLGCDSPSSTQLRQEQYAREAAYGMCVQCGDNSPVICGWCIRCAEAGQNYKLLNQSSGLISTDEDNNYSIYGSFLSLIVIGTFAAISKR